MTPPAIRLAVHNLTKRHDGRVVLDDVSLEVRAGEILGIIGPGGHGKSVLLKHLPRLLTPDAGKIALDGRDLATLSAFDLARAREDFGYLFQNYALFDFMTVADNIAFPLRQERNPPTAAEIDQRVRARLDDVGLLRAYAQFPRELSGGMKKRVGLARATVTNPSIAIYDDPSAGLDPVTSSRIFALILTMHRRVPNCASIVVSHDIDRMAPIVDRWIVIEHGRVAYRGTRAELAQTLAAPLGRSRETQSNQRPEADPTTLLHRFFTDPSALTEPPAAAATPSRGARP